MLYCGCNDGSICYYECSKNGSALNGGIRYSPLIASFIFSLFLAFFDCHLIETIRRPTREKKAVTSLRVIEVAFDSLPLADISYFSPFLFPGLELNHLFD
jgi:hypothetical protein